MIRIDRCHILSGHFQDNRLILAVVLFFMMFTSLVTVMALAAFMSLGEQGGRIEPAMAIMLIDGHPDQGNRQYKRKDDMDNPFDQGL